VLSYSPDLAYLREPVCLPFMHYFGGEAVFDPARDEQTCRWYKQMADRAFAGIPPRPGHDIVDNIVEFTGPKRSDKSLLIKEVNPLAAELFVERYAPKMVLLLRHPAAIAESFHRLGWLSGDWEEFGYLYGAHLTQALEVCTRGSHMVVHFEEFAVRPRQSFANLYTSVGVQPPKDFDAVMDTYCAREQSSDNPYDVRRSSVDQTHKWRVNLAPNAIEALRTGYLRTDLPHYRDDADWA
jgi:hypothetical protein